MIEDQGQELVETALSGKSPLKASSAATSTKTKKSVQESLLQFLESKKYGGIYLENNENSESILDSDLPKIAPFEIKDKERLSDPYALTAKFTNSAGLPQVVFDDVDYYVPSNSDDMTISEMSASIATGSASAGVKKTFLKGSNMRGDKSKKISWNWGYRRNKRHRRSNEVDK